MKKINQVLTILFLISLVGLLITFGLHEYHYSFDPYTWLDANVESVESRNLWNVRKELYRWWLLAFFIPTILFGIIPASVWLVNRRNINLK